MTARVGFVGDVHGCTPVLRRLIELVGPMVSELVFLGDYVNRGPDSSGTIDFLIALRRAGTKCTFLEGNHDRAFRECLEGGSLAAFLAIGGSRTILSYVDRARPDVESQLRRAVPAGHRNFLMGLKTNFLVPGEVFASHQPNEPPSGEFAVHGHYAASGNVPQVTSRSAAIDTGCGITPESPLTCFFYPDRTWIQADSA